MGAVDSRIVEEAPATVFNSTSLQEFLELWLQGPTSGDGAETRGQGRPWYSEDFGTAKSHETHG